MLPPCGCQAPQRRVFRDQGPGWLGEVPHAGPNPMLPHLRFQGTGLRTARMQSREEARSSKIWAPHIRERRTLSWES